MPLMGGADALPGTSVLCDVSGGRNGGAESAGRTPPDEFEFVVGRRAVFVGSIGRQRGNDKPVCDLSSAVERERSPNNHRSNLRRGRICQNQYATIIRASRQPAREARGSSEMRAGLTKPD